MGARRQTLHIVAEGLWLRDLAKLLLPRWIGRHAQKGKAERQQQLVTHVSKCAVERVLGQYTPLEIFRHGIAP